MQDRKQPYLDAFHQALADLEEMTRRCAQHDIENAEFHSNKRRLSELVESLAEACNEPRPGLFSLRATTNLTNAIRDTLREQRKPLLAPEIRDLLLESGFDCKEDSHFLILIHNALKRLEKQQEVRRITGTGGQPVGWVLMRPTSS
jgi:hypothetical protein